MSFSAKIKEEIFQSRPARKPHYRAFCYGLLLFGRRFGPQGIEAATEHPAVSKLCGWAIRDAVGARPSLSEQKTLRGQPLYTVELSDPQLCERLLASFGHAPGRVNRELIEGESFPAFLAGAFLVCGTASEPAKSYHMELLPPGGGLADLLFEELSLAGYPPKSSVRRGETVLYFKESEQIEDLLTMMGAPHCSLELMETKVYKDLRNRANRATNCETANIDKLVRAASQQLADIALLRNTGALLSLPAPVQSVAVLREQYPDASLSELSGYAGLSRSGVNHRLQQIAQAARLLREGEEQP